MDRDLWLRRSAVQKKLRWLDTVCANANAPRAVRRLAKRLGIFADNSVDLDAAAVLRRKLDAEMAAIWQESTKRVHDAILDPLRQEVARLKGERQAILSFVRRSNTLVYSEAHRVQQALVAYGASLHKLRRRAEEAARLTGVDVLAGQVELDGGSLGA